MMKPFRRGLVVGKFCPLHLGHELVIRTALAQCDEVVLLSYTKPEWPGCELERREQWLAARFPATVRLVLDDARLASLEAATPWTGGALPADDAPAEVHREFVAWLCLHGLRCVVDVVFTSEDYGEAFAAALTHRFTAELGRPTEVAHVCVDRGRTAVPVSGTALRADVHGLRHHLAPEVYASFVRRVAILGGESTGKSTLAAALAAHLGTLHVAEYGRELWEIRRGALEFSDLLAIADEQVRREEAAAQRAHRVLVCDTTPLTTLFYSLHLFGRADPRLVALAERRYDATVMCAPDFPFVQDGTRATPALRDVQDAWYRSALETRRIRFCDARGSVEHRLAQVQTEGM